MTEMKDKVTMLVYGAIDQLNERLAVEQRLEKSLNTPLLGRDGRLDSIGFINLIVLVEQKCQEEFRVGISLSDEIQKLDDNPVQTVGSFVDFLNRVLVQDVSR